MNVSPVIAIRVDASVDLGLGHAIRCLTLALKLRQRGAKVVFFCKKLPGDACDRLRSDGFEIRELVCGDNASKEEDAEEFLAALQGVRPDWVVVDHYGLDATWESSIRICGARLLVIDDLANRLHECDLLLDQNLVPRLNDRYVGLVSVDTQCLLGPSYALVRPEFLKYRAACLKRSIPSHIERVVVFLSGAELRGVFEAVLEGLSGLEARVDIVTGRTDANETSLLEGVESGRASFVFHGSLPTIAPLLSESDLAVTAGGSITWEKCVLGRPSLACWLAEHQRPIIESMAAAGAVWSIGSAQNGLDPDVITEGLSRMTKPIRQEMVTQSTAICDGLGVQRVVFSMLESLS